VLFPQLQGKCQGKTGQKTGHGQHSSKFVICVVFFVIRVVLLLIVMFYVLFLCTCVLPPGVNPTAVDKYININTYHPLLFRIFKRRVQILALTSSVIAVSLPS
jgi:hypothetical protein